MIRAGIFVGWLLVSALFKLPSRISFIFGALILGVSALSLLTNHQGSGLRLTTYAFFFFVVGIISYVREVKRYEKETTVQ